MVEPGIQLKAAVPLLCLALIVASGCTTKSKARDEARKAFLAGQQQGLGQAQESQRTAVRVIGNVKNPVIEWTSSLTLAEAIIAADYLSPNNPSGSVLKFQQKGGHGRATRVNS
jgi:hypothetical protein